MSLATIVLATLREQPQSRRELERVAKLANYSPAGVPRALWELKKAGLIIHVRRASRHVRSLYAAA